MIKLWKKLKKVIDQKKNNFHHENIDFGKNHLIRKKQTFFPFYNSLSNISDGVLRTVYTRVSNPNVPMNEQISIVGKVIQRAEVRPVESEEYMSMKRKHFENSQEPTRKAQMIAKKTKIYVPKRDHEENKQRAKEKKLLGKRVRGSEDAVLELIFSAFAKNQYISMASLETITQQPKNFLQQLVKRYCNYNSAVRKYTSKKLRYDLSLQFAGS